MYGISVEVNVGLDVTADAIIISLILALTEYNQSYVLRKSLLRAAEYISECIAGMQRGN